MVHWRWPGLQALPGWYGSRAQVAWGRYWGRDLKEVWTLITWLVYTLYWHLRRRPRWQGRRLAGLALAGLGSVLFTFLGVDWLARTVGLESLHLF
jgi:ABC-type transport system involved in cytochrome c biogenesis permease subunit